MAEEIMTKEQELEKSKKYVYDLLKVLVEKDGSDLFLSADFPPAMKVYGKMTPMGQKKLTPEQTKQLAYAIMGEKQIREIENDWETNFAIAPDGVGRFRVNAFIQQGAISVICRVIAAKIPNFDDMKLPVVLKEVALTKRGLVILVGGTGSGKSTTLAAMVDYVNTNSHGHIITIEDPVEYVHKSKNCLVSHREVGKDTKDWEPALKNTLRQAPNVILIGEIRDRETMEHALAFAETGHLCMSTLHANSSNQALDRIINFFPEERRSQLLMDLSLNLKGFVSQRLVPSKDGGRVAAIEILLNSPLIADQILKGETHMVKETMIKSKELGMQTFDMALFDLYLSGKITLDDALRNADSASELKLKIKLSAEKPEEEKMKLDASLLSLQM